MLLKVVPAERFVVHVRIGDGFGQLVGVAEVN